MCFSISRDSEDEDMDTSEDELEEVVSNNSMEKVPNLLDGGGGMHTATLPGHGQEELDVRHEPQLVSSADLDGCESSDRLKDVDFDDLDG